MRLLGRGKGEDVQASPRCWTPPWSSEPGGQAAQPTSAPGCTGSGGNASKGRRDRHREVGMGPSEKATSPKARVTEGPRQTATAPSSPHGRVLAVSNQTSKSPQNTRCESRKTHDTWVSGKGRASPRQRETHPLGPNLKV